jgi:hypothetical protein
MNLNGVAGRVKVVTAERSPMMLDSVNCMPLLPPLRSWDVFQAGFLPSP